MISPAKNGHSDMSVANFVATAPRLPRPPPDWTATHRCFLRSIFVFVFSRRISKCVQQFDATYCP